MRRRTPSSTLRDKARRRVHGLSDEAILGWAEQCLTGSWQAVDAYRRTKDPDSLAEAHRGVQQLLGVLDELTSRYT